MKQTTFLLKARNIFALFIGIMMILALASNLSMAVNSAKPVELSGKNHNVKFSSKSPKVYEFNGKDSYMEIPDNPGLSPANSNQEFTVGFWMKPDSFDFKGESSGYVNFLGKGERNSNEWTFRIYNDDAVDKVSRSKRVSFYSFNLNGGLGAGSYFQDDLKEGEWIHVTGVIDRDTIKIYKNGRLRDKDPLSGYDIKMKDGNAPVRVGTKNFKSWFDGSIRGLVIYNKALSDSEVLKLYNSG